MLAFLGAVSSPAMGQGRVPADGSASSAAAELIVSGRGEVRRMPDRASIQVVVETRASDAAAAGAANARRVQATLDTLARLGLRSPSAVASTGYGVEPEFRSDGNGRSSTPTGYVARNGIQIRLTDLTRIGAVVDAALAGGANRIGGVRYGISEEQQLQLEALTAAVTQARQRATVMAAAAGGTLGSLQQLTTERLDPAPGVQYARAASDIAGGTVAFSEARPETQVTPGELVVVVTVQGRWRFLGPR